MNSMILTGGRVIDPANRLDKISDVVVRNGKILSRQFAGSMTRPPVRIIEFILLETRYTVAN